MMMVRAQADPRNRLLPRGGCVLGLLVLLLSAVPASGQSIPPWLPRYDLDVHIDVEGHHVRVRERVTWINHQPRLAHSLVFNNHAHFTIADKDIGLLAKMLEVLRLAPSDAFDFEGPPCHIDQVRLVDPHTGRGPDLPFHYRADNATALEVPLPVAVAQGQAVTVELVFTLRLPQRQGRWGQWRGVTFLAQWLPVLAYYDAKGWQPTPFIPWHQPFHNEAGIYRATITLPAEEKLGCTGSIQCVTPAGEGWRQVKVGEVVARDFAIFCSQRFQEVVGQAGPVRVRCLHLPEHAHYGQQMVRIAREAIPVYGRWFGPFPYPEFTIVESYFGWNGNECGGVVMIDERVFAMPHLAHGFVDHLLTHEIGHQYFYNAVGTDGYAETWMDEGLVSYLSHKLMNQKVGRNNALLEYPRGLGWLPNIHREDYRHYGLLGAVGRGEAMPTVQELPKFGHLVNLSAMTYDRGGKIVGMIEDRLGETAMLDFLRQIYRKYYFRVLHVADFQRELEAYTGRSWQEFFQNWLYGAGMCDWAIERVNIDPICVSAHKRRLLGRQYRLLRERLLCCCPGHADLPEGPYRVVVLVRQKGQYCEPTVLGFSFDDEEKYPVRVPVLPDVPVLVMDDIAAWTETLAPNLVRVEIVLPCRPTQIAVDPDQVLLDEEPCNNRWKKKIRVRLTGLYSQLDETDLTNSYDGLNIILGPWVYGSTYANPWFTRSALFGLRAGVYRTQQYSSGTYLAYRSNDRNIIAGVDGLLDHYPYARTQIGFNVEQSLVTLSDNQIPSSRGVLFGRYVMTYGSSLYLPPFEYVEAFGVVQNRSLPLPRTTFPGANLFRDQSAVGLHYHKYYLTPYWNPEGGMAMDVAYQEGLPILSQSFHQGFGQVSWVENMPNPFGLLDRLPGGSWLKDTRFAFRLYGAAALPDNGVFFSLGGGDLYRGYDLRQRQGSLVWLHSLEWRVPLIKDIERDFLDHVGGLRNVYLATFYDVGNAYLDGKALGPLAHAVGAGLRLDVIWFGLIERTMLRLDVAKTVNDATPVQFWFGISHPF